MIHVVIGAPCAGKSTFVRERAKDGDVIVDYDVIATALGCNEPHHAKDHVRSAAFRARDAVIGYLMDNASTCEGWVIHTSPSDEQQKAYAEVGADICVLDTDMQTCLQRCEQDQRPDGTADVIRDWFAKHEKRFDMTNYKQAASNTEVDGGTVKGYASTFDREPDSYGDVIARGAFAKSIERWAKGDKPVPLLYGHNTDDPIYNIGAVTLMKEDERGLYIEAEFDAENEKAQYVRKLVKEGRLYQFSFAFDCTDWAEVELDDGRKANELRELEIYEVSLVQIPANQHAEVVDVKSKRKDDDGLARIEAMLAEIQKGVNSLLADEVDNEPVANADEPAEVNADEPKDYSPLIDEASKFLKSLEV